MSAADDQAERQVTLRRRAARLVIVTQFASLRQLEQRFQIGRVRAAAVLADLEEQSIIGPDRGPGRSRDVLVVASTVADRDSVIDAAFPRPRRDGRG